ncbi:MULTISPECIES: peptidoglycan D,D-transpeptidase FtsI family protein [Paenibacillus]|uniref:peptidoglycan D,D-transpeptidase FtsI family protein n=1 Tax=Paenibacillus TaxID=44249 RepID=UPI0022B86F47|nr:penicillin-binding transpeptidase domain-containing protein [Paenibacillus caseinilyticus]MCZ8522354.1 penicillin-binding transpeptidase domain-containing protein [Paenibacillus caseinilyticus]
MNTSLQSKEPGKRSWDTKRMRMNVLFFAVFVLFAILVVRLAKLQFVQGAELKQAETEFTESSTPIPPIRGNIFDRNGAPMAYTVSTQSLFFRITEGDLGDRMDEIISLATSLEKVFADYGIKNDKPLTAAEIVERMDVGFDINKKETHINGYSYMPRRIKSDLTPQEIAYLLEHRDELKWLEVTEESARVYDERNLAVQLIGYLRPFSAAVNVQNSYLSSYQAKKEEYLGDEYVGYDGLEYLYQEELRGQNGTKSYPINAAQKITGPYTLTPPVKGNNLILSMDREVQQAAEDAVTEHLAAMKRAPGGSVLAQGREAVAGYAVAMEVDTGKVMAMASMPDYDPNIWHGGVSGSEWSEIRCRYLNGAIRDRCADVPESEISKHPPSLVPLGSTIKPLTVLLGMNEKLFGPYETYNDTGSYIYGKDKSRVNNSGFKANGYINASRALEVSSNTFMAAMVGERLYNRGGSPLDTWDKYMKMFGLGVKTESDLPGESPGDIYYYDTVKEASMQAALVQASFGQQGRYTALQLAQYTAMLANKGKRLKPLFVDRIVTYDNKQVVKEMQPVVLSQETFPDTYWNVIREGMLKVSKTGFEGSEADYTVAAKTGTSQMSVAGKSLENAVFIAYAPAEKPKLAVAVVVPEGGYGAYGAAPIARKIFDAYNERIGLHGTPKAPAGEEPQ